MRNIIWFIAILILLLVQAGILLPFNISPVNLILVLVTMATLLSEFNQGLVITILGGLLLDFVSGLPDGILSISLLSVFLIMHLILNEVLSREPNQLILAAGIAGSTILYFIIFLIVNKFFDFINLAQGIDVRYLFSVQLPLTVLWNLVFGYPIYRYYLFVQNLASKLPSNEEPIRT